MQDIAAQTSGRGRAKRGLIRGRSSVRSTGGSAGIRRNTGEAKRTAATDALEHIAGPPLNVEMDDISEQDPIDPSLTQQVATQQVVASGYVPKFANDCQVVDGVPLPRTSYWTGRLKKGMSRGSKQAMPSV